MLGEKQSPPGPLSEIRDRLFNLTPSELGIERSAALPRVWAALMESGYEEGPVTLVVIADGTVSLYFPTGGGVIGAGTHKAVWAAGKAFLETADAFLESISTRSNRSLPRQGEVIFHVLTYDGSVMAAANEEETGDGVGPLSALFFAGQAVISQVRIAS